MIVVVQITLTGGRFLLSNKYSRMFVFAYTLLLHMFILLLLYRASHPRTVVIHSVGSVAGRVPGLTLNETLAAEAAMGNSTRTLADSFAEGVGSLMEATRDLTNQGSGSKRIRRGRDD